MTIFKEKIHTCITNLRYNFTRHTALIAALTLIVLTVLQGWIVALPWETDDSDLIGVGVGLSEVGCLIGATILSIFPTNRRYVHVLLFAIGIVGSILGVFAIEQNPQPQVNRTLLLTAFTFIGIATSIQPITVIVPVRDEQQTAVNANIYSMCRQLSYATTLLFALIYSNFGWVVMCLITVALLLLAAGCTYHVEKWNEDIQLSSNNSEPIKDAFRGLPKFVWVILIAFSASGFTEGVNNSMSVLVLKEVWITAKETAFQRTMTCPLIAVAIYPFLAMMLTYRWQFLLAMFLLGIFIILYPLMPTAFLGFVMLIFWNIGKTCMHSSVYSVIREATDSPAVIARLVALEQWTCTLFYGLAGLVGGTLYSNAFWEPFLLAGVLQTLNLVASFLAFIWHDANYSGAAGSSSYLVGCLNILNKPIPKSDSQAYMVLE